MKSNGRFQSAKNLQPARSLRTPVQNRHGPGNYGLPVEQVNVYQPQSTHQPRYNGNGGVGAYGANSGYQFSLPTAPATNGFQGSNNYNRSTDNGLTAAKGAQGQRRHDVLRSPNASFGSNASSASSNSIKEIATIVTFSSTTLQIGSIHEIYVSFIENGPKLFTVQLKAKENSLNKMMAALERISLRNLTNKPTLGMACIARFSEDNVLYRALIMGINVNSCLVSYVDFGNTETVEFKNLYEIPQEFLKNKIFSMRFTLSNVKTLEDTNADVAGLFSSLVIDKVLTMKVMPREGPAFVQYCELYENNENILEKLINLCNSTPLKYPPPITLTRGSNCMIIIRYIDSCRQFYVQPLENVENFEKIMDQLAEFCRKSSTFNVMHIGDICAACLSEDECYRAEIVGIVGNKIKVRLVDYGNTITLEKNQIKRLSPKFVEQQPQVVACCLEGFQEISDDNLSTAQLEMLAENENGDRKQFRMIVTEVANGVAIVSLVDEASTPQLNISKRLLKLNNPAKFVKEQMQQSQQQKQQTSSRVPTGPITSPAPVAQQTSQLPPPLTIHPLNPFHLSSTISEVPNLSQHTPPRMLVSEVIDLTTDDWPGGNVQPLGHQSSGYEEQHYPNGASGNNNGHNLAGMIASNRNGRESMNSSQSSSGLGGTRADRFKRPDIPRFSNRNQTPFFIEHDDRCDNNRNHNDQHEKDRSRDKATVATRNNRQSASGSESGFKTSSGDRVTTSQDSWKPASSSLEPIDDYVAYEQAFVELIVPMNTQVEIMLSFWISPEEFFVRMKDEENKLQDMMKQIQKFYRNKSALNEIPPTGSSVVAQKNNTFYRAKVIKYNESLGKIKVELVDFGNRAIVTKSELWKLERRFSTLPKLAIQCSLDSIKINCDVKVLTSKIKEYIINDRPAHSVFLEKSEDRYLCEIETQGMDLKMALLRDNFIVQILNGIDLSRLKGQTLKIKLMEIRSLDHFRIKILGHDAIINCRLAEAGAYQHSTSDEIQSKWLDQYCYGQIEDVSIDERLILTLLVPPFSNLPPPTIVDMPILEGKFTATVTYVHGVNCVYVQNTKWTSEIGKLLDDMYDYYEKSGETITNLQMNELCASKSKDGNWYRSKITCLQEIDNIEVLFVDYGNKERVRHGDLKLLEPQFHEYSAFAHKVYLPMTCLNEADEDALKLEIANLSGEYEMELKVLDYRNGIWIVDIASNDYSIVQALKDKQLAKDLDHEEIVNRKTTLIDNTEITPTNVHTTAGGVEDHKNEKVKACLCHVDNPNQLFLQMNSDLDDLNQLQENLQIIAQALPPLKDFSVDRYCIAPYSADDLWYRAKIIDSHDDLIIQFIDYGNSDVITSNKKHELKDVNESLMKFKVFAKQCSLLVGPLAEKRWSEEATMILRDLDDVDVQFLVECEGLHYIELKSGERDLAEELIAKKLAERIEFVPSGQRCFTSHTESIREFYLQLERDIIRLDAMVDYMARFEEFPMVPEPIVGTIYAAEFTDDGLWYRAQILRILEDGRFEVFFLDYGNTSVVSNVRELEKSIAEFPLLCTKCILRLPEGVKMWSDQAETKFKEIADMGKTVFTVQLHSPGSAATVDLFLDGNNINEQLLDLCEKGTASVMNSSFYLNEEKTLDNSFPSEGFVIVSHVNSPADFYIQFKDSFDALKNMEELLMITAAQNERLAHEDVAEGMFCVAYSKAYDKYHRAQILSTGNHQYKVLLVDHGSTAFATELRKMPSEIKQISVLAKRCCLENFSLESSALNIAKRRFMDLVQSASSLSFEIVRNDIEPNIVRLFTQDGRNVEELLELDDNDQDFQTPMEFKIPPTPTSSDLAKTMQRAKPKAAFFRQKSDLDFNVLS